MAHNDGPANANKLVTAMLISLYDIHHLATHARSPKYNRKQTPIDGAS